MFINVGKFIFPVNFIVLKTMPIAILENQISFILNRLFLASSNALIDCKSGLHITMVLNIFNMDKYTTSSLIEVKMVHDIHIESTFCINIKPTFEQIFKDGLILLDELAYIDFMYNDIYVIVPLTISKALRIYLQKSSNYFVSWKGYHIL